MSEVRYEYLLPMFIGHPFNAEYTEALRKTILQVCDNQNNNQPIKTKKFYWKPEFLNTLENLQVQSILQAIQKTIRESALCVFDITDITNANVFFELGVAIGMRRALIVSSRKPYRPPSDLQGVRGIEYLNMEDLAVQLERAVSSRLLELSSPPEHGQEIIHQKMQIDANWRYRIQTAGRSIYFFAGDLSWAEEYCDDVASACERGVNIYACCKRPKDHETKKWQNISLLSEHGAEVKFYDIQLDPRVRRLIVDSEDMNEHTEIMLVEKETRFGRSYNYERTGTTIGESQYLYKANIYRGHSHVRHVASLVRLFETIWDHHSTESYR